ncbi:MAG: hypothetical protein ACR2LX_09040 [Jatrophihabitans sp.]
MQDDPPESVESDIRRRAAWLLAMLVLVAALLVTIFVTFFNGSSSGGNKVDKIAGPTGPYPGVGSPSRSPATPGASSSGTRSRSASPTGSAGSSAAAAKKSCPNDNKCALDADIGDAIKAINDYRAQNGKSAVPGSVSEEAKLCALNNGTGCSGGWAETQVDKPSGADAVKKITQLGKLTSDMKSIEVGWAYDPKAKQYYFAIIRKS